MGDDEMSSGSGGFDDWLDEEPGPPTDPYAELADDDDQDITDWVAFTEGAADTEEETGDAPADIAAPTGADGVPGGDEPSPSQEVEPASSIGDSDEEPTGETEPVPPAGESVDADWGDVEDEQPTEEIAVVAESVAHGTPDADEPTGEVLIDGTTLDVEAYDGGVDPDTDEHIVVDIASVAGEEVSDVFDYDGGAFDDPDDDDTGELEIVPMSPFGGFDEEDASTGEANDEEPGVERSGEEDFDLTEEVFLTAATREHSDFADAIAAADTSETEQVAISAPIPGMADSVVGFAAEFDAEGMRKERARASSDLVLRIITGIVLVGALAASLFWKPALIALAVVVFVIGAGEFYTSLVRVDRKPIALFGFIGIIGASLGGFFWGALAIPMSFFGATVLLLLYYAVVPGRRDPIGNLGLTAMVMVWVGLGSFAMLIARSDDYIILVIGVVVLVAAMDIAQFFVGRSIGRTPLAPWVSPKKTVEGLLGGVIVAIGLGAALHFLEPFELTSGLLLGGIVAVLAPLGDLSISAVKRVLGLKDMGTVLPGHGGVLDRIDGLLFVIPAAWIAFLWTGLL